MSKFDFTAESQIEFVVKKNPKRFGSNAYNRAQKYWLSNTVSEYIENGGSIADLKYDLQKGFIKIVSDNE